MIAYGDGRLTANGSTLLQSLESTSILTSEGDIFLRNSRLSCDRIMRAAA